MNSVVERIASLLFPAGVVIGWAILVKSPTSVGDGFSAGVVIALGVAAQYIALGPAKARERVRPRVALPLIAGGLALLLLVALAPAAVGEAVLTHFPRAGGATPNVGALELHTTVLFDLGVLIVVTGSIVLVIDQLLDVSTEEGG